MKRTVAKFRLALHVLKGAYLTGVIFPLSSAEKRARHIQQWSQKLLRICGVQVRMEDAQGNVLSVEQSQRALKGAMVLSNHISFLDIYSINTWFPARFVAKSEIRKWPVFGWFAQQSGTIFIERTKRSDAKRIMHLLAERLQAGDTVCVFPEGTTSDGTSLLPIHANLLQAPVVVQADLLPIAIRYEDLTTGQRSLAPAYVGDVTLPQCIDAVICAAPLCAVITLGEIISTANMTRREAAAQVTGQIRHMLGLTTEVESVGQSEII